MNVLVSACLLGINCRYDGTGKFVEQLQTLKGKYHLIPVCPEIFGGMKTPREPAEKLMDKVVTKTGKNVTDYYKKGSNEVLKLAKFYNCKFAILKERSPSCGYGKIYDGTFSGTVVDGDGVMAELLVENGITILGESHIEKLFWYIK